mgnify:CR=1 FL=1
MFKTKKGNFLKKEVNWLESSEVSRLSIDSLGLTSLEKVKQVKWVDSSRLVSHSLHFTHLKKWIQVSKMTQVDSSEDLFLAIHSLSRRLHSANFNRLKPLIYCYGFIYVWRINSAWQWSWQKSSVSEVSF